MKNVTYLYFIKSIFVILSVEHEKIAVYFFNVKNKYATI